MEITRNLTHPFIWVPDAEVPTWMVEELKPEMIAPVSLYKGLSKECRFARQIDGFYSVAQHSVIMRVMAEKEGLLPPDQLIYCLLHDAAEAYLGDIATPIKLCLPDFQKLEDRVLRVIFERFQLDWPMPDVVHELDTRILVDEAAQLFDSPPFWIKQFLDAGVKPLNVDIQPWPPVVAYNTFRVMFEIDLKNHMAAKKGAFL